METTLPGLRTGARRGRTADRAFRAAAAIAAAALLAIIGLMLVKLGLTSAPLLRHKGGELVTSTNWNPDHNHFGALPFVYGTLLTSAIAIVVGVPVALATALFTAEFASWRVRNVVAPLTDLLAAVPSVIYGLWGLFVLAPTLLPFEEWVARTVGHSIPFFGEPVPGVGYFTAGIVLAIMIIPTVSAITREVFRSIPREQRDAALALGATRWEAIRVAVLPAARSGIVGAVILGLGRALGETIAVTMVIGNSPKILHSIFAQGQTMASVIAIDFPDAISESHVEALIAIGLLLFGITLTINVVARLMIRRRAA